MNREGDHEQPRRKERRSLPAGRLPLPENEAKDHGARRFFVIGLRAERQGDLATAKLDYKFALDLDPGSEVIQERMRRVTPWMGGEKKKKKKKKKRW